MTAAQKTAKANFKKAIEYRKKTGVSLKEAFAHVYGKKKVGAAPKKKAAIKKATPKKAARKKVGALPVGFKGSIFDVSFKIVNQYDIYGDVSAIVEDIENGSTIVVYDGKGNANDKAQQFVSYIERKSRNKYSEKDIQSIKPRLVKFSNLMQKEVKEFNLGKKKTIKKQPLVITAPKKVVKKEATKKGKPHTKWGKVHAHERRVAGVKKRKPIKEQSILNKIHKVKDQVNQLDELQHKHMVGAISKHNIDKIKSSLQELKVLETHLAILKNVKPKIVKSQLPVIKKEIKNTTNSIKEVKTHIAQLKKHI